MADEVKVYTKSGHIYYISERGGYFYVSKPSWMPFTDSVDSASTFDDAIEIIEDDAGEEIESIE